MSESTLSEPTPVAAAGPRILCLNAGSSTWKWAVYCDNTRLQGGVISRRSETSDGAGEAFATILPLAGDITAIGHRVVHGGPKFQESTLLTEDVVSSLDQLVNLAPLHLPPALEAIRAGSRLGVPQIGVFDTAFHAQLDIAQTTYPIPWAWTTAGVRRFGFHGIALASVVRTLRMSGRMPARCIVAHLGSGCSVTGLLNGVSTCTTMGFTPLDGIMMGTRPGNLDPGILLYCQQTLGLSRDAVEHALWHESGLLGVSGISADMRQVLIAAEAGRTRAKLAVVMFVESTARAVAAAAVPLGGVDEVIFSGGIGEHAHSIRAEISARLAFLTSNFSVVEVDEELEIYTEVRQLVDSKEVNVSSQ